MERKFQPFLHRNDLIHPNLRFPPKELLDVFPPKELLDVIECMLIAEEKQHADYVETILTGQESDRERISGSEALLERVWCLLWPRFAAILDENYPSDPSIPVTGLLERFQLDHVLSLLQCFVVSERTDAKEKYVKFRELAKRFCGWAYEPIKGTNEDRVKTEERIRVRCFHIIFHTFTAKVKAMELVFRDPSSSDDVIHEVNSGTYLCACKTDILVSCVCLV